MHSIFSPVEMPTRTSKRNERLFSLSTSASSFGQFLFYRPVRTVTGLIARSIFILPSCRNRHRTHHRWWRRITSILDFIIRISFVNIKTFFSIPNITAPKIHTSTLSTFYMIVMKPFIERCESFAQTDVLSLAQWFSFTGRIWSRT